ncbi:unnamed protein product [Caenorhabditis auriculariae]|uniref:Uncharacterized protein n=1 Tax=Caenorhabditis auriculariae TaxID=2777116 RepID=A0A8S1HIH1_9PELO|nr:unnamed protein product [Caenorhabditis auriculariae]
MSETSPAPYNPCDRIKRHLKRHLKRKSSSSRSLAPIFNAGNKVVDDGLVAALSSPAAETSNPFKKVGSPSKKRKPTQPITFANSVFEWEDSNAQDPFSRQNESFSQGASVLSPEKSECSNSRRSNFSRYRSLDAKALLKECYATDFSELLPNSKKEEVVLEEESVEFPLDLRPGTKLRLTSSKPFPWMKNKKTTGIVAVRITAADRYEGLKHIRDFDPDQPTTNLPRSPLAIFEASSLYWQFPVLPGLSLYPRLSSLLNSVQRVPMTSAIQDSINNQWVECFEQLFMSWKKGDRSNFYVATSSFNVLFTKTSSGDDIDIGEESVSCFQTSGGQKLIALVSHTTSAVREVIRSEGIEYEVIGKPKRLSNVSNNPNSMFSMSNDSMSMMNEESTISNMSEGKENENKPEEEKENSEDENESPTKANQQWLKEIGVSPRNIIKQNVTRQLSLRFKEKKRGDLVFISQGTLVHELTGAFARIPPTLIAASPFLYAQMLSLNKTSHVVQKVGKPTEYVVELDRGPILPHSVELAAAFLRSGDFCSVEQPAGLRVNDRYTNAGMNSWTFRAKDWSFINVHPNRFKWTKS